MHTSCRLSHCSGQRGPEQALVWLEAATADLQCRWILVSIASPQPASRPCSPCGLQGTDPRILPARTSAHPALLCPLRLCHECQHWLAQTPFLCPHLQCQAWPSCMQSSAPGITDLTLAFVRRYLTLPLLSLTSGECCVKMGARSWFRLPAMRCPSCSLRGRPSLHTWSQGGDVCFQ